MIYATKLTIGKFYMRSGNVIPFAALGMSDGKSGLSFTDVWNEDMHRVDSANYNFVSYKKIPSINFISFSNIEGIVAEKVVNLNPFTRWWHNI